MHASNQDTDHLLATIIVSIKTEDGTDKEYRFKTPFKIGRTEECEVCIKNEFVSRSHASILIENGEWWLCDLNSSNGIYIGDQPVLRTALKEGLVFRLGVRGPEVRLQVLRPVVVPPPTATKKIVTDYAQHYFGQGEGAGEHTMIIRTAFAQVQKKQKRKYGGVIAALLTLMVCLGGFALYQYQQASKQKALAKDIFYSMKSLDVDIANLREAVKASNNQQGIDQIKRIETQRGEMENSYDRYLASLHVYSPKMSEQDRLILRVARIFGECELDMPPDFVTEVNKYIKYWQSSGRLEKAIARARANNYPTTISQDMLAEGLPPQFFYLALQESDFDPYISGPPTRKGIAKGMWQFIPETAVKYGLHLGPLVDMARPDTLDDRHHYDRETVAAARYIKDLYGSDAQASGLLVMACYNWGEDQVLPLVRSMPLNPRDRNFWMLLKKHRSQIPQQTYDYVFYIVSAAVIGENPRLFGFHFDNPLANLETQPQASVGQPGSDLHKVNLQYAAASRSKVQKHRLLVKARAASKSIATHPVS